MNMSVPSATVDSPAQEGPAMTTRTNPRPGVPVPAGIDSVGEWDFDGYRDLYGVDRTVTDHAVRVYAFGGQSSDGTIYDLAVQLADGDDSGPHLNSDQACELASALLEAAAEVDGWVQP
jgi:hypothetical protein